MRIRSKERGGAISGAALRSRRFRLGHVHPCTLPRRLRLRPRAACFSPLPQSRCPAGAAVPNFAGSGPAILPHVAGATRALPPEVSRTVAEFVIIVALALVGFHLWGTWRELRSQTDATRQAMESGLARAGTSLGSLAAVATSGRADCMGRSGIRWEVCHVCGSQGNRPPRPRFLERRQRTAGRCGVAEVRGILRGWACEVGDQAGDAIALFQAGQVRTMQAVLRADRDGEALLAAANAHVVADIRWQGRSAGAITEEIVAAR